MSNLSEKENPMKNLNKRIMTPSVKNTRSLAISSNNNNVSTVKINKPNSISKFQVFNPVRKSPKEIKDLEKNRKLNLNILEQTSFINPLPNLPSSSAIINEMGTKTKRKFTELAKEKEEAKKACKDIIEEIVSLNEELKNADSKEEVVMNKFSDLLNREKVINFTKIIPESLNAKGSCLLENSLFYVLYLKFQSHIYGQSSGINLKLPIEIFLQLIDNGLMYDQNDLKLLYDFFVNYLNENYKKEEIMIVLNRKAYQSFTIDDLSQLNEVHFKYLLEKPESFLKFELDARQNAKNRSEETSSKRMKFLFKLEKSDNVRENVDISNTKGDITEIKEGVDGIHFDNDNSNNAYVNINEVNENNNNVLSNEEINVPIIKEYQVEYEEKSEELKEEDLSPNNYASNANNESEEVTNLVEEENKNPDQENQTEQPFLQHESSENNGGFQIQHNENFYSISALNFEISNPPTNLNLNSVSNFNNISKISTDAQILYQEIILRNKVDLEIEKSSLSFPINTPKVIQFKKEEQEIFSILAAKEDETVTATNVSNLTEHSTNFTKEPSTETASNIVAVHNKRAKSHNKKHTSNKHNQIPIEEEEETAEDIVDEEKRSRKNNNNVKNKKKYQSDKKSISQRRKLIDEDEEEDNKKDEGIQSDNEMEEKPNKKRKTKTKPKEKEKESEKQRGRSNSNSVSAKESEEEEIVVKKKTTGKANKKANKSRSKTNDRKKKK